MSYQSSATGALAATGRSQVITSNARPGEPRDIKITGEGTWVGSVSVEVRSPNAASWSIASRDSAGTDATYTANFCIMLTSVLPEEEISLNFTRTSGTLDYRIEQA